MAEVRIELGEVALPSTEFESTTLEDDGDAVRVRFTYQRDGRPVAAGIEFDRVRAYRHRAEPYCTVWHIDAYDTLTEIENSPWIAELLADTPPDLHGDFELHHYLIYLDSAGCYEAVAASWRFLPESPIPTS